MNCPDSTLGRQGNSLVLKDRRAFQRIILLGLGFMILVAGRTTEVRAGQKYALLVGCTDYPRLREQLSQEEYEQETLLRGPANDVEIIHSLLSEQFDFPADSIRRLVGWDPGDASRRPTRANIEKAFSELAEEAQPGDEVVIFMSGHGSYQPAPPGSDELDDRDEVFLPADAGYVVGNENTPFTNAIIDDEVSLWVQRIVDKGAFVWITFDSCHSGTMVRSGAARRRRYRYLAPRLSKRAEAAGPRTAATRSSRLTRELSPGLITTGKKGLVAFYATLPYQTAPEEPLPLTAASSEARVHGVLSYTLTQILRRARSPLTYRELLEELVAAYRAGSPTWPTPFAEGDLDREVLGIRDWPSRSLLQLETGREPWEVTGGALMGLTSESVLAVHPRPGSENPARLLGHVRVRGVSPTSATVEPVAYGGLQRVARLPDQARCRLVYQDLGDLRMKLLVQTSRLEEESNPAPEVEWLTHPAAKLPGDVAPRLEQLKAVAGQFFRLVDDLEAAEWIVRLGSEQRTWLLPAAAASELEPGRLQLGPYQSSQAGWAEEPARWLRRIYRWQNLTRLAGSPPAIYQDLKSTGLQVEFLKCRNSRGRQCSPAAAGEHLEVGQQVAVRLKNGGRTDLDVTLLFLDSRFGILPIFPRNGVSNRVGFDDPEPVFLPLGPLSDNSLGREYILVLALPGLPDRPPVSFAWLAQTTLPRSRAVSAGSPLHRLLSQAAFAEGGTRGAVSTGSGQTPALRLISWQTVPKEIREPGSERE